MSLSFPVPKMSKYLAAVLKILFFRGECQVRNSVEEYPKNFALIRLAKKQAERKTVA